MTNIESKIANLSPQHKDLLLRRLVQKKLTNQNKIIRNYGYKSYPASFTQTRFWFLNQLEPDSPVYNMPKALNFNQELNIEYLKQALIKIITRHETLRTTFALENGELKQNIAQNWSLELPIINLTNYRNRNKDEETTFKELSTQIIEKPFNLSQDLMLRGALFHLINNQYILLLVTHHIISDNWSSQIIIKELLTLYTDLETQKNNLLVELPIQYGDFAIWQKKQFEQELYQKQLDYWTTKLSGQIPILNLPTDKKRSLIPSYQGKSISFLLSKQLVSDLKKLSQQEEVTLFMLFLASFQVLLFRYTGQEDIIVGTPIVGRKKLETENLIACFLNILALRNNLNSNFTFKELLQEVKQVSLEAYANQDLPFEKLVEVLQPDRNLNHSPLFQVMLNFANPPEDFSIDCPSFIKKVNIKQDIALFDLSLYIRQKQAEIEITFQYSTDLFRADTIERMTGHFQTILAGAVNNPQQKISHLPLLTKGEEQQILREWNHHKVNYPKDKCIHQLFEQQVEKTPDAVAVIFEDQKLTYRKLNEKANQLAHYLQKLGVKSGTKVGICLKRSFLIIIALLGILKAGGAYLPLDSDYPPDRIKFMLEDANINFLLTQKSLLTQIPLPISNIVCLDEQNFIAQENKTNPVNNNISADLAYLIYTSGSTGVPKGVQIVHRSLTNCLSSLQIILNLQQEDVFLAVTTISFDIAAVELFLPLIVGAKLVIASAETVNEPFLLLEAINYYQVTAMQSTPSRWQMLINIQSEKYPLSVAKIWSGGEALNKQLAHQLHHLAQELWNLYGPTETTIWSLVDQVTNPKQILIGKPIANTQVYILDKFQQPTPLGVAGELHIAGEGLAIGYLNCPQLTAAKFIDNPFGKGKLYKTGDLARYLGNGKIEFLGRIDYQVKIRGFRLELAEIEANLNQHPNIKETVVIALENQHQDQYLVAYLIAQDKQPDREELRIFLAQKLPDYMIPSVFVGLDAFPLTANGKIDRKALPEPDFTAYREQQFIAPRNQIEVTLAQIWQEVLAIEKVGINDNFFRLGGHSLSATQVISRIRNSFKIDLPLRYLFEFTTIGELSKYLSNSYLAQLTMTLSEKQDREIGEI